MARLAEDDRLYVKDMGAWLKEHRILIKDAEQCAVNARKGAVRALKIAHLNDEQAAIRQQAVTVTVKSYNKWRREKGLKPITA